MTFWQEGCLCHNASRYPRRAGAERVDRLAGILRNAKTLKHANVSEWLETRLPDECEEAHQQHETAVAALTAEIKVAQDAAKALAGTSAEPLRDAKNPPIKPTVVAAKDLPGSLGAGEAESIAVCLNRPGTQLLTNDKRARNLCRERAVPCLDLPGILRALWVRQILSKKRVQELLRQIETEEGMVIKNKDEIFK